MPEHRLTRAALENETARGILSRRGRALMALLFFASACHEKQQSSASDASATTASASVSAAAPPPLAATPDSGGEFPTIAMPRPTVSAVPLDAPPDVRVTVPASQKAVVRSGQTFGIFVAQRNDFLEEWELEPGCPLGDPLAVITRGPLAIQREGKRFDVEGREGEPAGREFLWKIADAAVGTHVVKLRLMKRRTRESVRIPAERTRVSVDVVR